MTQVKLRHSMTWHDVPKYCCDCGRAALQVAYRSVRQVTWDRVSEMYGTTFWWVHKRFVTHDAVQSHKHTPEARFIKCIMSFGACRRIETYCRHDTLSNCIVLPFQAWLYSDARRQVRWWQINTNIRWTKPYSPSSTYSLFFKQLSLYSRSHNISYVVWVTSWCWTRICSTARVSIRILRGETA